MSNEKVNESVQEQTLTPEELEAAADALLATDSEPAEELVPKKNKRLQLNDLIEDYYEYLSVDVIERPL